MAENLGYEEHASQETRYCPYCAEVISSAAQVCRYCGGQPRDGHYGHPRFQVKTTHIEIGFREGLRFGLGLLVSGIVLTIIFSAIFLCLGGMAVIATLLTSS